MLGYTYPRICPSHRPSRSLFQSPLPERKGQTETEGQIERERGMLKDRCERHGDLRHIYSIYGGIKSHVIEEQWMRDENGSDSNFIGQDGEVLMGESKHITHFEYWTVSVVDWVKVTFLYVLTGDVPQEITPEE